LFDVSVYVLDIFYWPPAFIVSGTMVSSSASGFLADSETPKVVKVEEYLVD
jgi:hypothetical protein